MTEHNKEQDIFFYLRILYKHRYYIANISAIFVVISIIYVFVAPPIFTSYVTILPTYESEQTAQLSYLRNLAGQFGITQMPVKNVSELFPDIIKSRKLIYSVLQKRFYFQDDSLSLLDILKIQDGDLNSRLFFGYESLIKSISLSRDVRSNITKLEVSSKFPKLAADIATSIVEELDSYNRNQRTTKARENRGFIERRLTVTEDSLRTADYKLKEFRERNKGGFENSPELQMVFGQLMRELKKWEEIYYTLVSEYEIAKIQEIRDTPIINVLDEAIVPVKKSAPKRAFIVMLSLIIGVNIGIILSFIRESRLKKKEKE